MTSPLFEPVKGFFEQQKWPFTHTPDKKAVRAGFEGTNGRWAVYLKLDDAKQLVAVYSVSPVSAPRELMAELAELLTRANFNLPMGNFELDLDDGEIRFKTALDVEGAALTVQLVRRLVLTNVVAMDLYLPAVLAVVEKGVEPKEALARAERR
jgi:hypothetical protein